MTPRELEQRRRILFTMLTVLTFRYPSGREPALIPALRSWLSGWSGLGRIAVGMARQGFDLQLTPYDGEGWRATFFPEGRAHSLTAAVGSAWEREPWTAVQRAAWDSLRRREGEDAGALATSRSAPSYDAIRADWRGRASSVRAPSATSPTTFIISL